MIASHMDEIGLMVQYIDEKGFIKFVGIGGWFNPTLHTSALYFMGPEGLYWCHRSKPPHVMTPEDREKRNKTRRSFIDVGATSAKMLQNLVLRSAHR
jgi:endoglucanase